MCVQQALVLTYVDIFEEVWCAHLQHEEESQLDTPAVLTYGGLADWTAAVWGRSLVNGQLITKVPSPADPAEFRESSAVTGLI